MQILKSKLFHLFCSVSSIAYPSGTVLKRGTIPVAKHCQTVAKGDAALIAAGVSAAEK